VMIVGGTAQNKVVIKYVKQSFESVDVPVSAPYFEALGASLWALKVKQAHLPG
jgi:activator of 2-hydroxyglutaryl-CoA dehydratase